MLLRLRAVAIALLVASLAAGPAWAAPRTVGSIAFAEHAQLGVAPAHEGATVFAGDHLATDANGSLRLRFGSAQIYLLGGSAASVEESAGGVTASLVQGTVGFASAGNALAVRASGVLIRATTAHPTHGQVQRLSANEYLVSSSRGTLEAVVDNEVQLIPEGTTYRMIIQDGPQGPAGPGAKAARRARLIWILVGAGIAGAVVAFTILRNLSPARP